MRKPKKKPTSPRWRPTREQLEERRKSIEYLKHDPDCWQECTVIRHGYGVKPNETDSPDLIDALIWGGILMGYIQGGLDEAKHEFKRNEAELKTLIDWPFARKLITGPTN